MEAAGSDGVLGQADAMKKDLVVARPGIWQVSDGLRCRILGMRKFVVCFSSDRSLELSCERSLG